MGSCDQYWQSVLYMDTIAHTWAQCAHDSMFLEYSPSFYPVEQPPQNHTQGPNFCTLQLLLEYQN